MNERKNSRHNVNHGTIKAIQTNAEATDKKLTYQQAFSIYLRSCQLIRECANYSNSGYSRAKDRQIDICYNQHAQQVKNRRRRVNR